MFDGEEIILGPLPKGIVRAGEGQHRRVWNILGHTYWARAISESSFAFETLDPPGTGVPPHVHPTQDEHIHVLDGVFTLYLDGEWEKAGPGDTVLMPRGLPHAYYNRTEADSRALFWVSPTGNLAHLFDQLHDLDDPAEVVRQSALHDVEFLPPGSVPGARSSALTESLKTVSIRPRSWLRNGNHPLRDLDEESRRGRGTGRSS